MAVAPSTSADVFELIRQSGIYPPARLAALIPNPGALPQDPQKALGVLVAKGVLTRFQGEQLAQGRHRGFRMGSYVVQSVLGRGGMGAVYLAEHQELRRKVAIKVLVPSKDADSNLANERFLREARAAAALDHPNIVRIHDVCRHGEVPYLVMEYAEGDTLQQILDRDGTIPYSTAADYVAQAAAGLQHAFEKGFVHRDMKPSNLMRDKDGTVKLLDMGLARSSVDPGDRLTERLDHGAVVGTADFIAPEQAMDSAHADIRADIYSLGATFFALVTGKPPFEGNTAQKLLKHQLADIPDVSEFDESLPEELSEIVSKMLAKHPEDRYQTPGDVITALAPWVSGSSRVMAGLSRTAAGSSDELQRTIDRVAPRSSGRVGRKKGDSSSVNAGRLERETGKFAASATTRESTRRLNKKKKKTDPPKQGKGKLIATVAAAAVAVGAVCWVAFGAGSKTDPPVAKGPDAAKPAEPVKPVTPNPVAPVPPVPVPSNEVALYKLDLARQKPFAIRSGLTVSADDPPKWTYPTLSRTGVGEPPAGWRGQVWNKDTRMEFFADAANGVPAIGLRNAQGPASAMLFTPGFRCPTGACRLKIDYSANVRPQVTVRFKPEGNDPSWDVGQLTGTGTAWRVETISADLRGATGGFFEFHNRDDSPDAALRIRALTVAEASATNSPPVAPAAPVAAGNLVPGPVVYELDVEKLPPFRNKKEHARVVSGEGEQLPAGVICICWKQVDTGEFACDVVNGSRALGVTNLDGKTGQFAWELEKQCGVTLAAGKTYRVSVEYLTKNAGSGTLMAQSTDFKNLVVTELNATGGQWKTATATFVRAADAQVRLTFDCTSVGEGNTLLLRSLVVHEMVPGSAAPATESGLLYRFDFAALAPFRTRKEWTRHAGGDAEKLPPGVAAGCWKRDATGEFWCDDAGGSRALSLANLTDAKSAQFGFELEKTLGVTLRPGKAYRVTIGYATRNQGGGWMSVQTADTKPVASGPLRNTAGEWKTATVPFVRGEQPVRLTIENLATGEANVVSFRSLEIHEDGPSAAAPEPKAGPRELGSVYAVAFDAVPPFRKSVEQGKSGVGAEGEKLPPHVRGFCFVPGATAEFRAEMIDGAKALGFTNFSDKKSAQVLVSFESVPGGSLIPGKTYVARVTYRTANEATGDVAVQGPGPDYKRLATAALGDSGGKWKTVDAVFTRGDYTVDVTIDNTAVGEGNTLYVRSVEVIELDSRAR